MTTMIIVIIIIIIIIIVISAKVCNCLGTEECANSLAPNALRPISFCARSLWPMFVRPLLQHQ